MATIKRIRYFITMALLTLVCQVQASSLTQAEIDQTLRELRNTDSFTCTHEQITPTSKEVESIFRYGQYLEYQAPESFSKEEGDFTAIARYYRIAVAEGYYPAYTALINLLYKYRPDSGYYSNMSTDRRRQRDDEIAQLKDQLLQQKTANGYLEKAGELAQQWRSAEAAAYYYLAAKAGSAEGQYKLAEYLDDSQIISKIAIPSPPKNAWLRAKELYLCAASQGHQSAWGDAAAIELRYGTDDSIIPLLQRGVAAGSTRSAILLEGIFQGQPISHIVGNENKTRKKLNIKPDLERAKRYEFYFQFLISNQDNFVVSGVIIPDVNKYVPLPPAPLPEWDGILPQQKNTIIAVAKPPEALIKKLSRKENLDPASGRPMN
ncbi:DUF6396 domain-containing protein [Buttiauxella selenatireducens]|uniref:DUF6396 domain-containing protein n=1 Tax=Buttiauxella selenatireducens TaxID=3073902 RepID=A0ABY9S6F1_9ENTR|nr:DUF6396 domain-containing protein [Buttiauxella sp. R73]WMY72578.1 DUF6396 domain-containing protein [Buttiauxella sp. R73]